MYRNVHSHSRRSRPLGMLPKSSRQPRQKGAYIDPSRFINKAVPVAEEIPYEPTHTFNDFKIHEAIKRNIADKGYVSPSAIQDQAIPLVLEGKDLIGLANTGTGKTAAFILPLLDLVYHDKRHPSVLIMAPTRELAVQIDDEFKAFAKGSGMKSVLCVGGVNIRPQIDGLRHKPEFIIGTPGRLKDLSEQGYIKFESIHYLVLDEADRMLDMGFIRDIRYLVGKLPTNRQSLCFSATMTPDITKLIHDFLTDPVTVSVRKGETSAHIEQDVVEVKDRDEKFAKLIELLSQPDFDKVLVFGQTKHSVQRLSEKLSKAGIPAEAIHGNKSQPQRQRALKSFKDNKVRVLVATDVAARGLDIPLVSHVINFDQPNTYEDYVHRIGRTGRAGNRGSALTFVIK